MVTGDRRKKKNTTAAAATMATKCSTGNTKVKSYRWFKIKKNNKKAENLHALWMNFQATSDIERGSDPGDASE